MSWNELLVMLWVFTVVAASILVPMLMDSAYFRGYNAGEVWTANGKEAHIKMMQSALDDLQKHYHTARKYGDDWKKRCEERREDLVEMLEVWDNEKDEVKNG